MAVGKSPIRKDAVAKVTGRARYTDDLSMPGMLYAKYVRSPIAHGRVLRIDTVKARNLHGVEAVFTFEDVSDRRFATAGHPYSLDSSHADIADYVVLFAATGEEQTDRGPKKKITSFLVDKGTPGFNVRDGYRSVSHRGYHNNILEFDDMQL